MNRINKGQQRKQLEIELSKEIGIKATKAQVIKSRKLAARLSK